MNLGIKILACILCVISGTIVCAETEKKEVIVNCERTFAENGVCPQDVCEREITCASEEQAIHCTMVCHPKECVKIDVKDCPLDRCAALSGCGEEKVCYPQIKEDNLQCGDLAYIGEKECCEGFVKRCGVEFLDGNCDMRGQYSVYNAPICVPCGNGVCNQFENQCNCPEDCTLTDQHPL